MTTRARLATVLGILIVALVACGGGSKTPPAASHTSTPSAKAKPKSSVAGPYIVTATSCLHIRKDPSLAAIALACVSPGSLVIANGKSKDAEGYTWYQVSFNEVTGWAANKYLKRQGKLVSPSPAAT
jgi:hypothetical protein